MLATEAPRTIGQHIDAALAGIDSLSSTQLYALIVGATVVISFLLLGSASETAEIDYTLKKNSPKKTLSKATSDAPEPRWHIFRYVNYTIVAAFLWSVAEFSLHAADYWSSSDALLAFLVGWSVFLCYFFGFFGVSFVHDITGGDETNKVYVARWFVIMLAKTFVNRDSHLLLFFNSDAEPASTKKVHPPASSTQPVCSIPKKEAPKKALVIDGELAAMSDADICQLVLGGAVKDHELEKKLDPTRAVAVRRLVVESKLSSLSPKQGRALDGLPHETALDYSRVHGANCEIVIGYVPLPVGLVGPLTLNNETVYVPMATTEGCLVASTNRGAKAISAGGGAHAEIVRDGITRAPCIRMPSAMEAARLKLWCERPENFAKLKQAFESTTSFGKLQSCSPTIAGRNVYLRLVCFSGDAMGMNMVSKGSLTVIECLKEQFESLQLVALSGNMCTDKKAAATNWLEGRGKSVVVEATIPADVVKKVLKTNVDALVDTNLHKNLIGSAMAGTIGGFNAHASNIVTAVFLATGQDPAQNVESSNCITLMEKTEDGDLWVSCTMPSLEVGTVGGGTSLEAQASCLQAIGCRGGGDKPGENAQKLAKVVAAATMAGELSLLAALAANTLVAAHMQHNRKK